MAYFISRGYICLAGALWSSISVVECACLQVKSGQLQTIKLTTSTLKKCVFNLTDPSLSRSPLRNAFVRNCLLIIFRKQTQRLIRNKNTSIIKKLIGFNFITFLSDQPSVNVSNVNTVNVILTHANQPINTPSDNPPSNSHPDNLPSNTPSGNQLGKLRFIFQH